MSDPAARASSSWEPIEGIHVRIVAGDGTDCPVGEIGEVRLRGPQAFSGYLESALDADTIDEQGYVRTGDLGRLDERGLVTITGRIKEIVVRNGENISVAEVEAVLATHPAIADVVVIGLPDPGHGERCCAVVSPVSGAPALTVADVAAHCRAAGMARYKTPEQVEFLAEIPRNAMGKVRRDRVREALAERVISTQPEAKAGT
jgi:acyl-CoA synthetase (AMP-forming)/AMP-acid ligase II